MNDPTLAEGKVSIVIPCYNHGLMLLETLASIGQVRSDTIAEVIIVNDGSNEPATCQVLQNLDTNKYKVLHQPGTQSGAECRYRNCQQRIHTATRQ